MRFKTQHHICKDYGFLCWESIEDFLTDVFMVLGWVFFIILVIFGD